MKKILLGLLTIGLFTGCATQRGPRTYDATSKDRPAAPSEPKPHKDKYAVQVVEIEVPSDQIAPIYTGIVRPPHPVSGSTRQAKALGLLPEINVTAPNEETKEPEPPPAIPLVNAATLEKFYRMPEAVITEHPVGYATIGETVVNDSTTPKAVVNDAKVVEGKTVKTTEKIQLGGTVRIWLVKADGNSVTCNITAYHRNISKETIRTLENGDQVAIPAVESRSMATTITQPAGTWIMQGGLNRLSTMDGETKKTTRLYCIRVIPPASR